MYNCPTRWYTVVDVCRRSVVDEMSVDEFSWNRKNTMGMDGRENENSEGGSDAGEARLRGQCTVVLMAAGVN